jgi:hypothetical protein
MNPDAILRKTPKPSKRVRAKRRGLPRGRSKRAKKSGGQLFHGAKFRDPKYQAFIRRQPCILAGRPWSMSECFARHGGGWHECIVHTCVSRVRGCHVISRGAGGPDVGNMYPGCDAAHDDQHNLGIPDFERRWNVNLRAEALRLQALYESQT